MNEGTSKLRTEACNKALFKKHTGYFHNYTDMSGIFDQFSLRPPLQHLPDVFSGEIGFITPSLTDADPLNVGNKIHRLIKQNIL